MNEFDDRLHDAGHRVSGGLIDLEADPDGVEARSRRRSRVRGGLAVLALAVVVAAGVVVASRDGGDDPGEEVAVQQPEFGGPYDGLESVGLPVMLEPDNGLVDGQTVTVQGEGMKPRATVAATQCWLGETGGSADDCDLGNIATGVADAEGRFRLQMEVRRIITTSTGTHDCADGGLEAGCRVGVADVEDYDQSGSAAVFFDPEVAGSEPPIFTVEPSDLLVDGDTLFVAGRGFEPGETTLLTQCVLGGFDGMSGCLSNNPTAEIVVDDSGEFRAEVPARRWVNTTGATADCVTDPYGCRIVVQAARTPNPVAIAFDQQRAEPPDGPLMVDPGPHLMGDEISFTAIGAPQRSIVQLCLQRVLRDPEAVCEQIVTFAFPTRGAIRLPVVDGVEDARWWLVLFDEGVIAQVAIDVERGDNPGLTVDAGPHAVGDVVSFAADESPEDARVRLCYANPGAPDILFGSCFDEVGSVEAAAGSIMIELPDLVHPGGLWTLELVYPGPPRAVSVVPIDVELDAEQLEQAVSALPTLTEAQRDEARDVVLAFLGHLALGETDEALAMWNGYPNGEEDREAGLAAMVEEFPWITGAISDLYVNPPNTFRGAEAAVTVMSVDGAQAASFVLADETDEGLAIWRLPFLDQSEPAAGSRVSGGDIITFPGVAVEGGSRAFIGETEVAVVSDHEGLQTHVALPDELEPGVLVLTLTSASPEISGAVAHVYVIG
ncbi:MAG: neocarzinostatin apoprotein domain-containing protein [Acidimicrobiales bacterium]